MADHGQGNTKRDRAFAIVHQCELPVYQAVPGFWDRLIRTTAHQAVDGIAAPQQTTLIQHPHKRGVENARVGCPLPFWNDVPGFIVPANEVVLPLWRETPLGDYRDAGQSHNPSCIDRAHRRGSRHIHPVVQRGKVCAARLHGRQERRDNRLDSQLPSTRCPAGRKPPKSDFSSKSSKLKKPQYLNNLNSSELRAKTNSGILHAGFTLMPTGAFASSFPCAASAAQSGQSIFAGSSRRARTP